MAVLFLLLLGAGLLAGFYSRLLPMSGLLALGFSASPIAGFICARAFC
jgi:hypothetical protein